MTRLPVSPLISRGLSIAEKRLGMTELAKRLGAPETTIRAWMFGHAAMPEDMFLRLVDILIELNPDWLDKNSPGDEAASPDGAAARRPLRIIVADDNFDAATTLTMILRDEGYDVLRVLNGRNALEAVRHFDPDVVILDIAMPDLSGWEVASKIRETSGQSDRPLLIAITGRYKQAADRITGEMVGFNHYLVKPYDTEELLKLLAPL